MWRPAKAWSSSSYWKAGEPLSDCPGEQQSLPGAQSAQWDQELSARCLESGGCPAFDGHSWKALAKEDPLIAELRLLCRDEVALIEERTALVNQLQSALQEYYPAALEAFEDWTLPAAWAFVELFPNPARLVAAGQRKWEKFLHLHKLAPPQTYAQRLEIFARGSELTAGEALTRSKSRLALARIRMLRVLQTQIEAYRAEIEKLFAQHQIQPAWFHFITLA